MRHSLLFVSYCILLFSLPCSSILGQEATIQGTVVEAENPDISLPGASISIGLRGTFTDESGSFSINIKPGKHVLVCSFVGYEPFEIELELAAEEHRSINIAMETEATLLEMTTISSSKYEKPLGEVTVSLEVIQPELLERNNSTSVDEVLDRVPGLTIADGQADIRGGSGWAYGAGSRVLLLVDDIPALQPDAGFPQWDDLPVENLAQVEVIKGASSALYGSSALNGVINLRTGYPKSRKAETRVNLFYTAYDSPKIKEKKWWSGNEAPFQAGGGISHARSTKKLDYIFSGYALNRESFNKDTYQRYFRLTTNLKYRITDRFTASMNVNYNNGEGGDFFYWRAATEAEKEAGIHGFFEGDTSSLSNTTRERFYIDPQLTFFDKGNNRHKLLGRYYSISNQSDNNQSNGSNLFYGEYQFHRQFVPAGISVTGGVVGLFTNSTAELYADSTYKSINLAGYIQVEKKFADRLNISAGFRFEQNSIVAPDSVVIPLFPFPDSISPAGKQTESRPIYRIGASYQLGEGTFLRGSYGQGYRFPVLAEKFISTQAGAIRVIPNPALQSETGWSAELGVKHGFRLSKFQGFIDIAYFWMEYQDMMEFSFTQFLAFQSQNIGNTVIRGVDISIQGKGRIFGLPFNILTGYTRLDPKFKEFDTTPIMGTPTEGQFNADGSITDYNVLKYRRKDVFKVDLALQVKNWEPGLAFNTGSPIENMDQFLYDITQTGEFRKTNPDGYGTFDVRLAFSPNQNLKFRAIVANIFNQEYTRRPGLMEAPRNFTLRSELTF